MFGKMFMPTAAETHVAPERLIPCDIDIALDMPDWRQRVSWPVSLDVANAASIAQMRRALAWAGALDDRLQRDVALLALPNILGYGRAIMLAAMALRSMEAIGAQLESRAPEITFLLTGIGEPPARREPILPSQPISFEFARRMMRCHSWTGTARLLPAMLAPQAVAVSHNSLLRSEAARDGRRVSFRHAESFLTTARRRSAGVPARRPIANLARLLARAISEEGVGDCVFSRRASILLEAMALPHLEKAVRDLAALQSIALPEEIWSGSGGLYAPRAVGLEVLRRGGRVVRFDHGTQRGFVKTAEVNELLEFCVSSDFFLATDRAADICRKNSDDTLQLSDRSVTIHGACGDSAFAQVPARRANRPAGNWKRVVYAPTQLLGFRQVMPNQPQDTVYLDWQMRVVEAVQALQVELLCQPHPEGFLRDRPHPLEKLATTIRGNFERQIEQADIFIFDSPTTTALWQAACSDARIIFLDIGAGTLTPEVARLFAERAKVIKVDYDDRNRPVLDVAAVRDAVLSEGGEADPTPFRRLLAGEQ
jgi:hypothetical protein